VSFSVERLKAPKANVMHELCYNSLKVPPLAAAAIGNLLMFAGTRTKIL